MDKKEYPPIVEGMLVRSNFHVHEGTGIVVRIEGKPQLQSNWNMWDPTRRPPEVDVLWSHLTYVTRHLYTELVPAENQNEE